MTLKDLDKTIESLLEHMVVDKLDSSQVEISFDLPNRQWSAGIQGPTINCYLFDIHERRNLREEGWHIEKRGRDDARRHKPQLFYDISYLITAWTPEVDDEHDLLWHVLDALSRFPVLNDPKIYVDDDALDDSLPDSMTVLQTRGPQLVDFLSGDLKRFAEIDAPPIYTTIAQLEGVLKSPGEFWTALENHLKPSLSYVITLPMKRMPMRTSKPVRATGIRIEIPESTAELGFRINRIFTLPPGVSLKGIQVTVEGRSESFETDEQGQFRLDALPPGRYTLNAHLNGVVLSRKVVLRDPRASGRSRLTDVVLDQDGNPLAGVVVEVEGTDLRAVTGADGRFGFDIAPGTYTLIIHFASWTQRRRVTVRNTGYTLALNYGGKA